MSPSSFYTIPNVAQIIQQKRSERTNINIEGKKNGKKSNREPWQDFKEHFPFYCSEEKFLLDAVYLDFDVMLLLLEL